MRRARVLIPVLFGLFVFAGLSVLLARGLTGSGTERAAVLELVRAQARGDADAVLAKLPACRREPACAATTRDRVAELRSPGAVQLLTYTPSARLALTRKVGTGRVAWRAGSGQAGRPVRARAARRTADRRRRGAALAVGADRRRGGLCAMSHASNPPDGATCRRAGCWDSP